MKNRHQFLHLLMLLPLLLFSSYVFAQSPPRDPERDLSVSFAREREGTEFGAVHGQVTNRSINSYPCVRLDFHLYGPDEGTAGLGRRLGILSVVVRGTGPRSVSRYREPLPYAVETIAHKSVSECSKGRDTQNVVIYDDPNFEGRSRTFGIGSHRLFNEQDFNDATTSISVPAGLAVIVYQHADEGGGYGTWVDFLEDQPDLSIYDFNNKISYLVVFSTQRSGFFYARNGIENNQFVAGHWERDRASGNPVNPNPVVGPPKPPNTVTSTPPSTPPRIPPSTPTGSGFCSINVQIDRDKPEYNTFLRLHREDGSQLSLAPMRLGPGLYKFLRVPEGRYQVIVKGNYPTGSGREGSLAPMPKFSQPLSCRPNETFVAEFVIRSTEG